MRDDGRRKASRILVMSSLVKRSLVTLAVQTTTEAFGVEPWKLILNDQVRIKERMLFQGKNDLFHFVTPVTASTQMLSLM